MTEPLVCCICLTKDRPAMARRAVESFRRHDPTAPMVCFRCKACKPADDFYLVNGKRKGPCKACRTETTREWALKNPDKRRANWRNSAESRRELHNKECREYYQRDKPRRMASLQDYWARNPEKRAARHAVAYAIRTGRLKKQPCVKCGGSFRIHAHHHDYSKPLDVTWLCSLCHGKEHRAK